MVQQQEAEGIKWSDDGAEKDVLAILKSHGFNWIRLRIFVNPEAEGGYSKEGFCDLEHTLQMAKRVKEMDKGWKRIQRDMKKVDSSFTKIGVQQDAIHKDEDSGITSDLAVIAAVHEFGAPNRGIPERPFIRTTADEVRNEVVRKISKPAWLSVYC